MRSLKLPVLAVAALAVVAGVAILGRGDTSASSYNPSAEVTVANTAPGANSDGSLNFTIPAPDANFQQVIAFTPAMYGIGGCPANNPGAASRDCADLAIPNGAYAGQVVSDATLGLLSGPCSSTLFDLTFNMQDATTDLSTETTDTLQFSDEDGNGLVNGVEAYPDYLKRLIRTEPFPAGAPAQPIQRLFGMLNIQGVLVALNFLVFEPGTTINGQAMDPILGYPSYTQLQDTGDPGGEPEAEAITDFCTPLDSTTTSYGITKDNPDTDADESGNVNRTNPADGGYDFVVYTTSQRDFDDDGIENGLDPCWDVPNSSWDPRNPDPGDDTDSDSLPNQCDPVTAPDPDLDHDGDGFLNRGDNCPLVANDNKDVDIDGIGDACDPDPNTPSGHNHQVCLVETIEIGTGGDPGGDPTQAPPCGNTPSTGTPTPPVTDSPTPTPSGGVSPTPTSTGPTPTGATPTPTGTGPTPTPTPTPTATPVPTVTPTAAPEELIQGDMNCDDQMNAPDAIAIVAHQAGVKYDAGGNACQPPGSVVNGHTFGDLDCDDDADVFDALIVLKETQGIDVPHEGDCPDFGEALA